MRLKTIKLSGFKSFVDTTTVPVAGTLIGVVGPNGCGKSNIIDAVRWVMGESSAKHLRGDSMADVIFNGSNARKPVGKASVELIFDNSDGRAGGQYAAYGEIAIRREAGRDGQSDYFLNKTRCRRKDITDLFLGTGLGPRAYSIIEQGMVTRIIEAKPEDLRGFIEEAAGISRYKERRRETENRIKHTRENLARVQDIRQELETQLGRLQRQSRAANRYKQLKQEERAVRAQLLALRYRELDERLKTHDALLMQHQTALDAVLAAQREIEARIETLRARHSEAQEAQNSVQAEYYASSAEISRLEQAIEHARETRAALLREQEQLSGAWNEASEHLQTDRERLGETRRLLGDGAPALEALAHARDAAAETLRAAEAAMQQWQDEWAAFSTAAAAPATVREIQSERIRSFEQHIQECNDRQARLADEARMLAAERGADTLDALRAEARALDAACDRLARSLEDNGARVQGARAERERLNGALDTLRGAQQAAAARLAGLRELQAAAEARHDTALSDWLRRHGLEHEPRLASRLRVAAGWEQAVERVLGTRLAAVCAAGLDQLAGDLGALTGGRISVVELGGSGAAAARSRPALLDKIESPVDLAPLLGGVYIAESLAEALAQRAGLAAHESFITSDGVWVGRNWLNREDPAGSERGWLAREREIQALEAESAECRRRLDQTEAQVAQADATLAEYERERADLTRQLNERQRARAELRECVGHAEAQVAQLEVRAAQVERERAELQAQLEHDRAESAAAAERLRAAEAESGAYEARRADLQANRRALTERLTQARQAESDARERSHRLEIERQALQTTLASTQAGIARLETQLCGLNARREELAASLAQNNHPEAELKEQLNEFLAQRLAIETRLAAARGAVGEVDNALREQEQLRGREEKQVEEMRAGLETERVARQELLVRRDTCADQAREDGADFAQVLTELPADATEPAWRERLDQLVARIERLGPINLVAIEEFEELSSRKGYLDKQHEDLSQALATLDEAIRKMDRETRTRFKETFDRVNEGFQNFFPQLFGGGNAYLELTDNDLLETGVSVMARPPGKRNSTIHLLSGGEKALAAVALLFAIFELNPAPFCLLDEVDAPLDDANVERYCETLKTMSARTQLVFVTHNKISMELADILIGVTMSEPGVSRLVAVDVEEALRMVAQ